MKIAIVFSSPELTVRRNRCIAGLVDDLHDYLAIEKLHDTRLHWMSADGGWTRECLALSGHGLGADELENAILKVFPPYNAREKVDAAIKLWLEQRKKAEGSDNIANILGLTTDPNVEPEEVVRRFHEDFAKAKENLQIAT